MNTEFLSAQALSECRIVIIEDDFYQAHAAQKMLQQAGAHVVSITATAPDLAVPMVQ